MSVECVSGISFTLRRSTRARTMRLAIHPDGNVVVTAPNIFGLSVVHEFFNRHSEWVRAKVEEARGRTILRIRRADIPRHKQAALSLLKERVEYYAALYGVTPRRISVRAQKSRWGSCSEKGNLSFNYKLVLLHPRLIDYVVAHEVCHLRQFNHSPAFWKLVAETFPDHKKLRDELRRVATMYS